MTTLTDYLTTIKNTIAKIPARELVIVTTVLIGVLTEMFVYSYEYEYIYHYTIGFTRSFFILILCAAALKFTESARIMGLMVFITVSMVGDLASIMSQDIYYLIKPYRYTNEINFKNLYRMYEVLCVLLTFIVPSVNYLVDTAEDYINRHHADRTKPNSKGRTVYHHPKR